MRQSFIDTVAPIAVKLYAQGSSVLPSIRIAQALLESGGQIPSWNNLFGMKVGNGQPNAYWNGDYIVKSTREVIHGRSVEVQAKFRKYDTIANSFRDQELLYQAERYRTFREAGTPAEQAQALVRAGYATDPQYAVKLMDIINRYQLEQYDTLPNRYPPIQSRATIVVPNSAGPESAQAEGYLIENRLYVPVRFISEQLDVRVDWDNTSKTARVTRPH